MSAIGRFLGLLLALFGLVLPAAGAGQGREEAQGPEVPVYLFWSASCPHCLAARPQIQALADRVTADHNEDGIALALQRWVLPA